MVTCNKKVVNLILHLLGQHEGLRHEIEGLTAKGLCHVSEVHPQTILSGEFRGAWKMVHPLEPEPNIRGAKEIELVYKASVLQSICTRCI